MLAASIPCSAECVTVQAPPDAEGRQAAAALLISGASAFFIVAITVGVFGVAAPYSASPARVWLVLRLPRVAFVAIVAGLITGGRQVRPLAHTGSRLILRGVRPVHYGALI